jgi:hypothetical protein
VLDDTGTEENNNRQKRENLWLLHKEDKLSKVKYLVSLGEPLSHH